MLSYPLLTRSRKASGVSSVFFICLFTVLSWFLVQRYEFPYRHLDFFVWAIAALGVSTILYCYLDARLGASFFSSLAGLVLASLSSAIIFVLLIVDKVKSYPDGGAWMLFCLISLVFCLVLGTFCIISMRLSRKPKKDSPNASYLHQRSADYLHELHEAISLPARQFSCRSCRKKLKNNDAFCPWCGKRQ